MRYLIDAYKKTGALHHHAYVIEGNRELALQQLFDFFEQMMNVSTKGNPDFYYREFETLGIAEGRLLQERASKKALEGNVKIFVLVYTAITREAQNALLKLFEEPVAGTYFFLITPQRDTLLPTFLSRCVTLSPPQRNDQAPTLAKDFLVCTKGKRIQLLKDIIDAKDKARATSFLNDLEALLRKTIDIQKADAETVALFKEIAKCRMYLNDRAPSVKMLLEHIALITP